MKNNLERNKWKDDWGRGKKNDDGSECEEDAYTLKQYNFDAHDMKETVKDHKPNFVKAPKKADDKHDGYYSEGDDGEDGSRVRRPGTAGSLRHGSVTQQQSEPVAVGGLFRATPKEEYEPGTMGVHKKRCSSNGEGAFWLEFKWFVGGEIGRWKVDIKTWRSTIRFAQKWFLVSDFTQNPYY